MKSVNNAVPENIGKIVTVQIFERKETGGDELDLNSLEKYVGTLQAYYHSHDGIVLKLEGVDPIGINQQLKYVEIHTIGMDGYVAGEDQAAS